MCTSNNWKRLLCWIWRSLLLKGSIGLKNYVCFCCEVVSATDCTNWKELLNLANFNLIGWYTVFQSAKKQKLCLQATRLIKLSTFLKDLSGYCHQTLEKYIVLYQLMQNCINRKMVINVLYIIQIIKYYTNPIIK